MKNFIFKYILILSLGILFSCKSETADVKKNNSDDKTPQKERTTNTVKDSLKKTPDNVPSTISGLVYGVKDIPKDLKYDGKVVASVRWTDKNGDNILIITETDIKSKKSKNKDEDPEQSKWLYGYNYILQDNSNKLLWKIQDFVDKCDASVDCTFIPNSLTITDINGDGIAESTFLYKLGCRSDVSPIGLKLMMHENDLKYALRGETLIKLSETYGGEIKNTDPSFEKAPAGFLDYAKKQWELYKAEKLE
jgi:hypothetical protein